MRSRPSRLGRVSAIAALCGSLVAGCAYPTGSRQVFRPVPAGLALPPGVAAVVAELSKGVEGAPMPPDVYRTATEAGVRSGLGDWCGLDQWGPTFRYLMDATLVAGRVDGYRFDLLAGQHRIVRARVSRAGRDAGACPDAVRTALLDLPG